MTFALFYPATNDIVGGYDSLNEAYRDASREEHADWTQVEWEENGPFVVHILNGEDGVTRYFHVDRDGRHTDTDPIYTS